MLVMLTEAPTASAPALKHRSTTAEFLTTASGLPERTRHSRRTSAGDGVHRLSAPSDDSVNADGVLGQVSLPVGVDRLQRKTGGVERVDSQVGSAARMSAAAGVLDKLDHVPVAGASHGKFSFTHVAGRVAHHRQVHVVELPQPDKLLLASQEFHPALFAQLKPLLDVYELLGRDSEGGRFPRTID